MDDEVGTTSKDGSCRSCARRWKKSRRRIPSADGRAEINDLLFQWFYLQLTIKHKQQYSELYSNTHICGRDCRQRGIARGMAGELSGAVEYRIPPLSVYNTTEIHWEWMGNIFIIGIKCSANQREGMERGKCWEYNGEQRLQSTSHSTTLENVGRLPHTIHRMISVFAMP
jgi:hypothetical protein